MDLKTVYRVAATTVACIIGAGFVSGYEIWSFFGEYGWLAVLPIALAIALFGGGAAVVLWYAHETDAQDVEQLVSPKGNMLARRSVTIFELVLHYSFYILMAAAAGSLGWRYGLPTWVGSLFFCAVCTIVSMLGIKGLAKVFAWMIPILTVAIIAVAIYSFTLDANAVKVSEEAVEASILIPHFWPLAMLVYFCFNFVGAMPIVVGAAKGEKTRGMPLGALCAVLPLAALAICLFSAVMVHPNSATYSLPMMALAEACHPIVEHCCAVLMLCGMFSTGFSALGSIHDNMTSELKLGKRGTLIGTGLISVVAFVISLLSFTDLIDTVYPVLGYIGFIPITVIFINAGILFVQKRKQKKNSVK